MESEMAHAVVRCTECHKEETRSFFHHCPICQSELKIGGRGDDRFHVIYSFACEGCGMSTTQRLVDY
jgi:Zn finger protein HypA/HybF involved in hydrogenase expression